MHHSFDIHLAAQYGVEEAILIHHFQHWINLNQEKGINFYENATWSYQTRESIADHFPYLDRHKVRRLTDKLVKLKVLKKGNFNKSKFDKTIWYAFCDEKIFTIGKSAKSRDQSANGIDENGIPIPYSKALYSRPNRDISNDMSSRSRKPAPRQQAYEIVFSKEEGRFQGLTEEDGRIWREAYPEIDLGKELAKMASWIKANPRKSNKKNWRKFIVSWLSKSSDQEMNRQARNGASIPNDEQLWTRANTKLFYEWKEKANGSLDHCYIKNGYLINKENGRECRVNLKPEAFENLLCDVAGVKRSNV